MKAYIKFDDCKFQITSDGSTVDLLKLYKFISSKKHNNFNCIKKDEIEELFKDTFLSHAMVKSVDMVWCDDGDILPSMNSIRVGGIGNGQVINLHLYQIDSINKLLICNTVTTTSSKSILDVVMGFSGDIDTLNRTLDEIDLNYNIEQKVD